MQNSKNSKKNTLIIALFADVILCQENRDSILTESNFARDQVIMRHNVIRFGQPVKVNIRLM